MRSGVRLSRLQYGLLSSRLQLSPSPSSHAAVPRVQERRKLRGRKRKHEEAGRSSPAYKMSRRSVRTEAVTVTEVDGKYVRIKNNSDKVRLRPTCPPAAAETAWRTSSAQAGHSPHSGQVRLFWTVSSMERRPSDVLLLLLRLRCAGKVITPVKMAPPPPVSMETIRSIKA